MEFLILVIIVLAFLVWHLMSNRHDGSVKCPKCKAVNVGTKIPCWNCKYEFEKPPVKTEKLKTCPKCKKQYYASPDWDNEECYQCAGVIP
jgi:predicted Zn-ribbon and HTH transcriptional regulator